MSLKRKRSSSPLGEQQDAQPEAQPTPAVFEPAPMPDGRSLLLELAPELRNDVYEKVCEDGPPAWLPRQSKKREVINTSPLALVSKQVRKEFLSVSTKSGPLATSVRNYNFGHLITFFNRLSDIELKRIEGGEGESTPERQVCVTLCFATPMLPEHEKQLTRWLERNLAPEKKGTQLDVQYSCKPWEAQNAPGFGGMLSQRVHQPSIHRRWRPPHGDSRYKAETDKMVKAIKEARKDSE